MPSISRNIVRWLPLALILSAAAAFFYFGLYRYFTFNILADYHQTLKAWTHQHYFSAVLAYILVYIVVVAISVPGAAFLTLLGGFLFGVMPGVLYVIISATIGACIVFLAVSTAFGDYLARRAQGWVRRMEEGFRRDAWNYLLFLRLIPLFPFWVVNIIPALSGVRLSVFASATFLGMIPGSLVYAFLGRNIGVILSAGKAPDLTIIFQPVILIPLVFLGALSIIPVFYHRIKKQ